jgi:hypothetical protein
VRSWAEEYVLPWKATNSLNQRSRSCAVSVLRVAPRRPAADDLVRVMWMVMKV